MKEQQNNLAELKNIEVKIATLEKEHISMKKDKTENIAHKKTV